jgi:uncharacterized protein (DUF1015 family)
MIRQTITHLGLMAVCLLGMISCAAVKPYQKGKLNDSEMALSSRRTERLDINIQSYREGASGANGGRAGGGCGCN